MTKPHETTELNIGPRNVSHRSAPMAYAAGLDGIQKIAATMARFSLSPDEMASLLGADPARFQTLKEASKPETQRTLDDMLDVLERVRGWATTEEELLDWYRSIRIPSLGMTPDEAVRRRHAKALHAYIDQISVGGFA